MIELIAGFLEGFLVNGPDKGLLGRIRSIIITILFVSIGLLVPYLYYINLPDMSTSKAIVIGIGIAPGYIMAGVFYYAFKTAAKSNGMRN